MKKFILLFCVLTFHFIFSYAGEKLESDVIKTSDGDLKITFVGHGTLLFEFKEMVIHVDPVNRYASYDSMPKADLILITHEHGDHLSKETIDQIKTENTKYILTQICADRLGKGIVMKNGDSKKINGLTIEAVPAYNIVHKRSNGEPYHPKGNGNGYVIHFGDKKIYVAGDTENIPEMVNLKDIYCAFLPMNLPYTMSPEMAADAAKKIKPKILYPYHYGSTDTNELIKLLEKEKNIEIRIRQLQ